MAKKESSLYSDFESKVCACWRSVFPSPPTARELCLNRWRITPFTLQDCLFSHFKRNQCAWAPRRATLCHSDLQMTTLLPPKACLWLYIYICFAIRVCASWCVCVCVCTAAWQGDKDVSLRLSFKDNNSYCTECFVGNQDINEAKVKIWKLLLNMGPVSWIWN